MTLKVTGGHGRAMPITDRQRRAVIERARGVCEYCQTQQAVVIVMEVDHIVPLSAGGRTSLDNMCLACPTCNGFKLDYQTGIDPASQREERLFNPRQQVWQEHFAWSEDSTQLIGLTPTGRATIQRLRINEPVVIEARRRWVEVGWHPPKQE